MNECGCWHDHMNDEIRYCSVHEAAPDLVKALEYLQSLAKNSYHRTPRTLLQMCSFFDDIILPTIDKALAQIGESDG